MTWSASRGTDIRWTTDGIPHVRADNWMDLGRGVGYVQAKDVLCTLAEAFVTFGGQRTHYFGPDAHPTVGAPFGMSANLDLDVFFRAFVDDDQVALYRAQQPQALDELVARHHCAGRLSAHVGHEPGGRLHALHSRDRERRTAFR